MSYCPRYPTARTEPGQPSTVATTKEQAEAYNYEGRRQATSLMTGQDEARNDPRRRINRVTVGGVLIGVLVMAGFGIAGFLGAGRGPALPQSGAVLVAGTGDQYVIVDGRLHPALNLASALLVGGGQSAQVRPAVLDQLPRGLPVGIPDAPDALPPPGRLTAEPWTVCAVPSGAATLPPQVTVRVGGPEPGAGVIGPGQAVLATGPDGALWMLNEGRRYRLLDNTAIRLLAARSSPLALPAEVLDTLPEGPPIAVPAIGNPGRPAAGVPNALVTSDIVRVEAGGSVRQSFVVLADGLAPVSELTASLLVAAGAVEVPVDPAIASAAAQSRVRSVGDPGWPDVVPQPVGPQRDQPLCVSTTPGEPAGDAPWTVRMSLPGVVLAPGEQAVFARAGDVPGVVDQVVVPRGAGALVRATTASGGDGALTLVTDSGLRFAIPTPDAATRLRYDPAAAPAVPAPFVALLPAGPALDPELAAQEFTGR
jgi:type VII secretion protein EccB